MKHRIAIFCPVHGNPPLVRAQLRNYHYFFEDEALHILHPSLEGVISNSIVNEWDDKFGNIQLSNIQIMTSWRSVMGAFIANTRFLRNHPGHSIQYVYLHTDSDLLVRGDIPNWIYSNEIGFGGNPTSPDWNWPYISHVYESGPFRDLLNEMGIGNGDILIGRQEGAFIPYDIWDETIHIIERHFPDSYFDDPSNHWPIEESVLPTLLKKLTPKMQRSSIIIKTKELPQVAGNHYRRDIDANCIQVEDLHHWISNPDPECLGLKWFSQDLHHPARALLRSIHFENQSFPTPSTFFEN